MAGGGSTSAGPAPFQLSRVKLSLALVTFALPLTGPEPCAADSSSSVLYELTTQTGMPHLEESLRYTTTTAKRCLGEEELFSAFTILSLESLRDCELALEARRENGASYRLSCKGSSGTTGDATWRVDSQQKIGTLNVKLGGKNMTFFQRVTAKPLRACSV